MMTDDAKHVSLFRIEGDNDHWGVYDYRIDVGVGSSRPKEVIEAAMRAGRLPNGGDRPRPHPGRPDRFLDIRESAGRRREKCVYAFHLNATIGGNQRLKFVPGSPFIPLPLNATGEGDFLTDFEAQYGDKGLWASFCCDLNTVRGSKLADRIKRAALDHEHHHAPVLTIPFCFNVIDPDLGASPWVVPRHSHTPVDVEAALFTHGGVHPSDVAFLSVEL